MLISQEEAFKPHIGKHCSPNKNFDNETPFNYLLNPFQNIIFGLLILMKKPIFVSKYILGFNK